MRAICCVNSLLSLIVATNIFAQLPTLPDDGKVEGPYGLPVGMTQEATLAMIKIKAGQFNDPNIPILASAVTKAKLISVVAQMLGDTNSIEVFEFRLYVGEVRLLPDGIAILRRDGIREPEIEKLRSMSEQGAKQLVERRTTSQTISNWLAARSITIPPPKSGGSTWEVPFVIGEEHPFIEKLVADKVETKPSFHFNWVSPDYESTQGHIEVLLFAQGKFPIGIMSLNPEQWVRSDGKLMSYKYEDMDHLVAGVVKFNRSAGMKIRVSYSDKNADMVEDAVYFSNESAFIAVRLRAKQASFHELENKAFIPFLNSVVIHDAQLKLQ